MGKPKIRFEGYSEDWEQRKLDDVLKRRIEQRQQSEEYPRLAFASGQGVIPLSERKTNNREQLTKDEYTKKYLVTELNDIVYNPANVKYGAIDRNKCGRGVISPIYVTFTTNEVPGFIERIVTSHDFQQRALRFEEGTVTKRQSVNPEDLVALDILVVPKREEQQKIATYLDALDHVITLHQRKYDETKTLKKYMLQKMFPQNGEKVPEIRFDGFTEDWEQRKLGDNIVEYTEKTTENNQYPVLTSSRKGIFFQTDYYDGNQIASADNTGYNIVPYGYFTYRHMSDDEIFHFNINDIAENGIVSTLYPVFTTDENLDSRYLQYQLNYGREFARYAILQKQGGSRTYMYLNKLRNLYLTVPTAIEEQKKISEYFTNLDHLITLHQRKCNELKEIKKYMLQNMFV